MKATNAVGWAAVALVTLASSFWAYWGVNEAFHEGWCRPSFGLRVLQVLTYLGPAIVMSVLAAISVGWPKTGTILFVLVGGVIAGMIIISQANFSHFITIMLTLVPILIGILFFFGRPSPRPVAQTLLIGLPLLIIIGFGAEPVIRIANRFDDGDRGIRLIEGNGVKLVWAPAGPGWARDGLSSWEEALCSVDFLNDEGTALELEPQYIWRLPTRDELVRSMTRNNQHAGGVWDPETQTASYDRRPDKESPLWDSHAPLIYLWTSEDENTERAWIVVYHGGVFSKPKMVGSPSFGFRAVRDSAPKTDVPEFTKNTPSN